MSNRSADVQKLARGEAIATESFLAILSDPAAVAQLTAQREMQWLLDEMAAEPALAARYSPPPASENPRQAEPEAEAGGFRGAAVESMDVSWEELALYVEERLHDPARAAAVQRFLEKNFPEAVLDRASLQAASAAEFQRPATKRASKDQASKDQAPKDQAPDEHAPDEHAPGQRLRYRDDSELA